ncbi:protein ACTIVITY OF BC1 COMPLEX KINASE 7, chloroplastic-like isoform X1 [Primulina huaijiensis]|uniref:protein ACTIVITY OF BC1 COMPLEX KINASE 7, chloroplastic-like isoform X1 n=1 Tax=Primulina huaijiensis TaxID=1492673 RepID=UPI003CC6EDFD
MAAILASHSCCCRIGELKNNGRVDNLNFFGSALNHSESKFEENAYKPVKIDKHHKFQAEMQRKELPAKSGSNRRAIKMVPTTDHRKNMLSSTSTSDVVNGSVKTINGVNVVNGASLVKRDSTLPLAKSTGLPPIEGVKVLPNDEGFSWANENYNSIQRSIDVWFFVISLRVRVLLDNAKWTYIGGFTEDKQANRRQRTSSWLRESLLQLGPTFIKLGQLSSTRSDLLPKEFVNELANLQDRVPAFSPKKAKNFIEKELGAPIQVLFKEFEELPIAAASLGTQGYFAQWRKSCGESSETGTKETF